MTKAELITAIADKAGLNKTQAKDALEAFISSVTERCHETAWISPAASQDPARESSRNVSVWLMTSWRARRF